MYILITYYLKYFIIYILKKSFKVLIKYYILYKNQSEFTKSNKSNKEEYKKMIQTDLIEIEFSELYEHYLTNKDI